MEREETLKRFDNYSEKEYLEFLKDEKNTPYNYARVILHAHTDYGSPKDSILTAKEYAKRAKAMGAHAISITDHGTMYGLQPLYEACKKEDLKLLIGVEFYVCDTVEEKDRKKHARLHLCGYAKNMAGYLALSRLVTASNNRTIILHTQDGDIAYPCISKKLLQEYVGPGSEGHGNVILTSACIGGVLTGISRENAVTKKNIELLDTKIEKHQKALDSFLFSSQALEKLEKEKEELQLIAKKTYGKRKQYLKKHPNEEEEAQLAKEELESQQAAIRVKELAKLLKEAKSMGTASQKEMDAATGIKYCDPTAFRRFLDGEKRARAAMDQEIVEEGKMEDKMEEEAKWYDELAGHGNWFIEIQYHGIAEEKLFMPYLVRIAERLDLPLVAANDVHMASKEDAIARKYINSLRFNKWEPLQDGDTEYYLKDDVTLFQALKQAVGEKAALEAMVNRELIADACDVTLQKNNQYPKYVA